MASAAAVRRHKAQRLTWYGRYCSSRTTATAEGSRLPRTGDPWSAQWPELAQHGRNELRDRRMDVHRALHDRHGRLGIHQIENAVHHFVAGKAEQRCAKDLLGVLVDQDFHEALSFALFIGAADILHRDRADQPGLPRFSNLRLRHACTPERRIGVERVGGNAVRDTARFMVEKICRYDLEIVVRRVSEGAAAIAITQCPDTRHIGAELIVHLDEPALIRGNAGLVETEVVGIWPPADREQQMRADDFGRLSVRFDLHLDIRTPPAEADNFRIDAHVDAFALENVGY